MNYLLLVSGLLSVWQPVFGSRCGESTIPFSLEILPSGHPVLGCARPTCFGWHPKGYQLPTTAKFSRLNRKLDGFLRDDSLFTYPFETDSSKIYKVQNSTCEPGFQSSKCDSKDQWVGGIEPETDAFQDVAYQCCTYAPLRESTDRNIATVSAGEIVIGGEVYQNESQYAFDYISNIEKSMDENGEVYYEVNIRRFACLDPHNADRRIDEVWSSENTIRKVNGQKPIAQQAPNVAVNAPIEAGTFDGEVVDGQTVVIEEIIAQQGFIVENETTVAPFAGPFQAQGFQPRFGAPQGFQPAFQQPPPQQFFPQNFQPVVQQPVQFPAQPVGYAPYAPAGWQLHYCFPADAEVNVYEKGVKRMDELEVGDWVQALHGKETTYSPVKYWLHRDPEQEAEFVEFLLENGESFTLTEKHLVFATDCQQNVKNLDDLNPTTTGKINIGECFFMAQPENASKFQKVQILDIQRVRKTGIYAPMTSLGHLLVNQIHTSCHSEIDHHLLQNSFFKHVLKLKNRISKYFWNEESNTEGNIGTSLNFLIEIFELIVPSKMISY
nr:M89 [Caenorhabditis elegans]